MSLPTPFYDSGGITIYCGDMRQIVEELNAAAVITDPPYDSTGLEWDKWPDGWPRLISKCSNNFWCFGSLRMFWDNRADFTDWKMAQELVWEKHNGSGLHNDRFRRVHELMVQFYQGEWQKIYHSPVMVYDAQHRKIRRQGKPVHWGQLNSPGSYEVAEGGPRLMRSVIYCKSTHMAAEHPTQKPEGVIYPLVEYSVPKNGLVLDPFMGSGTTLRVAKNLGRRAIGIDLNEEFCRIAARRMEQETLFSIA